MIRNFTDVQGRPRKGDWIQTYSGRQVFPLCPDLNDYNIVDIAAALSKLTRYNGHCLRFYSVAEHCVLMLRAFDRPSTDYDLDVTPAKELDRLRRAILLHDASESYLCDPTRPVKPYLVNFLSIEDALMHAIARRFAFDWPMPAQVKYLDTAILHDEMLQNMAVPPVAWRQIEHAPLGVTLQFWSPDQAYAEFMRAATEIGCGP